MKKSTALKCRVCVVSNKILGNHAPVTDLWSWPLNDEPITVLVFVKLLCFAKHMEVWTWCIWIWLDHYSDVIMGAMAFQITSLVIVYSTVYSSADKRKHQSYASLAFVRGIHRWPVNSPYNWSVMRKMFPFDDVIMMNSIWVYHFMKFWMLCTCFYISDSSLHCAYVSSHSDSWQIVITTRIDFLSWYGICM